MAKCSQCGRSMPSFTFKKICAWCEQYQAAQRGEESDIQPVMAAPWKRSEIEETPVTLALLAINCLIFVMMVVSGVDAQSPSGPDMVRWGANFGPLTLNGEIWRLVSHMFLHFGYIHLMFNMWFLYSLGTSCERMLGSVTYTGMYFVSGIAGGVASLLVHPNSVSAGASGALFGILGSMIAIYKFGDFSMPRALVQAALRSMLMCAGINLLLGVFGSSDNSAHIGGLLAGALIGLMVAKAAPEINDYGRRAVIVLIVGSMVGGGVWWLRDGHSFTQTPEQRLAFLMRRGRKDEAIAELQKRVARNPNDFRSRLWLASLYESSSKRADAFQQYEWVLSHGPKDDYMHSIAGTMVMSHYLSTKDYANGERYFAEMVKKDPSDAVAHGALADLAEAQEHHEIAIDEYKKVTALWPERYLGFAGLGRNYAKLQRYDDAIAAYRKAIDLSKDPQGDDEGPDFAEELKAVEQAKQAAQKGSAAPTAKRPPATR